jgi:catechol 2,3-dioxygenase-like lactoylglutathione lyase family enzyme
MSNVTVRYIVSDVGEAINFYTKYLGFKLEMNPAPAFAILSCDNLRLLLSSPSEQGGGGRILSDGTTPKPGGWNRFHLEVENLEELVKKLRNGGAHFRNEIVNGIAGKQILLEDPSGNPIELFEYYKK